MLTRTRRLASRSLLAAASAVAIAGFTAPVAAQSTARQQIAIEAQPLGDALIEVGRRYGVLVSAPSDLTRGKRAPRVSGSLNAEQAIARLLAGSGLAYERSRGGYVISPAAAAPAQRERVPRNQEAEVASQNESPPTAQPEQTIVVTGSRIERTVVNAPAPIDIVTAKDIEAFGLNDSTEALRFVPALNQSGSVTAPPDRGSFGQSVLDLRGLGADRTLVLVNGRRHVSGVVNTASVDVATIPSALVERVEVLTGGGSSIYGADAVSGVVNYILKDNFEGLDVRTNFSLPTQGDGESYFGAITAGGNFAGGRGNAVFNAEYFRQTSLRVDEREISRTSVGIIPNTPEVVAGLGTDPRFQAVRIENHTVPIATTSTFSLTGSTLFNQFPIIGQDPPQVGGVPNVQIVDPVSGQVRPLVPVPFVSGLVNSQGGDFGNFFFRDTQSVLIPDTERYVINMLVDYDLSDRVTGFVEAKYVRTESVGRTVALVPTLLDLQILPDNPFIPQPVQDQLASLAGQGIDTNITLSRLLVDDQANRPQEQTRETFRVVGGVKGDLSDNLSYEVSANYGRTSFERLNPSGIFPDRFFAAADAVTDPETGSIVCRSDLDPTALPPLDLSLSGSTPGSRFATFTPGDGSCAPLNLFVAPDQLDQAAADFIFAPRSDTSEIEQVVFNAIISGSTSGFFELPGGAVRYAAGVEYREERSQNQPNAVDVAGVGRRRLGSVVPIGGGFDVFEGFAEFNVPLLADLPFIKSLAIDASVRVADYSTAGTATSYGVGAVWQPIDDFRLRGSFNRAVRAPNITELFAPQFIGDVGLGFEVDPCDPVNVNGGTANREANCRALIPDLDNFSSAPTTLTGVTLISGGNPDLEEETADTFSVGFALTPSFLPGLSIVSDYYRIEIEGAISRGVGRVTLLNNCVDAPSLENPFCAAAQRNPTTGLVERIQDTNLNLSSITSEGIDYQIDYTFGFDELFGTDIGQFNAQIAGTYLIERDDQQFTEFPDSIDRLDGELNFPKHFINFTLSWAKGPWSLDYGLNYQSSQVALDRFGGFGGIEEVEADPFFVDQPFTGDAFVHFLGGAFEITDDFQISLRVNNLFDRDPFATQATLPRPVGYLGRTVQLAIQGNF